MAFVRVENLIKKFGNVFAVDHVSFTVDTTKIMTLLGPSGCGKTTTLRCVAGLEEPTAGEIFVDEQPFFSEKMSVIVPPEKRNIGMVFQSYAVWPHKTVFENVALGLRIKKFNRATIEKKTREVLNLVRLNGLESRYPTQLSGGQQQRVALARSLVQEPKILLFDEPLSNLDLILREQMRYEIRELQKKLGITTIYVTHDQTEAMVISDVVCVMDLGKIVQIGTPMEIYNNPKRRFVAEFIGSTNLLGCMLPQGGPGIIKAELKDGLPMLCHSQQGFQQGKAFVSIRPERIYLSRKSPEASDKLNIYEAKVEKIIFLGSIIEYRLRVGDNEFFAHTFTSDVYPEGETVFLKIDPEDCRLLED
ncbi:MAG: ABC transporter ATP-binding protein [Deltaproteobacteria bacterium]|nr:ABC transporter ATP-binding protein [Deltaproteobacteria bacterium]